MFNKVESYSRSKIIKDAIILFSLASLCFSGSFNVLQFLPAVNATSSPPPLTTTSGSAQSPIEQLNTKMAQISSSNNPADIATLAYIWGFSPVTMQRQFNFVTSPNVPPEGVGRGPANTLTCARDLQNANSTDVVSPNSDTLYCFVHFDLKKEPVVLVVPAIPPDRYHTFEFLDAYTNVFAYLGTRATGSNGGTYLIAGPDWNGQVPQEMTKIWSPTNLAWVINHILAKGPSDVTNVHPIQDKIIVKPLSVFQGKAVVENVTQPSTSTANVSSSSSKQVPIGPQPYLIAPTGIKIYDEIGKAMIGNPLNPPNPTLVTKMESIGIGPGKTPSTEANDTIKAALQTGIEEGQKMIDTRVANIGNKVNGWLTVDEAGVFGTDYLLRAACHPNSIRFSHSTRSVVSHYNY